MLLMPMRQNGSQRRRQIVLRAEMATGYTITLSDTSSKKRESVCVYERERDIEREMYRKRECVKS